MKMTSEHYQLLTERATPWKEAAVQAAKSGQYPIKRILWRVFHRAEMYQVYSYQEFDYYDTHIETAMKKLFKDWGIELT